MMLALLCWRARRASGSSQQSAARTPLWWLQVMVMPLPVEQIAIPISLVPFSTEAAIGCAKSG